MNKSNNREYSSDVYGGIRIHAAHGLHERCAELIGQYLPKGSRLLDVATGSGAFTQRLIDLGYEVEANDIDHTNWSVPSVIPSGIDLNQGISLGSFGEPFDAVVAMEILEHLENPVNFLRNIKGLCRNGGFVLLTTPNIVDAFSYLRYIQSGRFLYCDEDKMLSWGHIGVYPYWLLEGYYQSVGLNVLYRCSAGYSALRGIRRFAPWVQCFMQALLGRRIPKELRTGTCLCYMLQKS